MPRKRPRLHLNFHLTYAEIDRDTHIDISCRPRTEEREKWDEYEERDGMQWEHVCPRVLYRRRSVVRRFDGEEEEEEEEKEEEDGGIGAEGMEWKAEGGEEDREVTGEVEEKEVGGA
jgi:hypothetical protein